MKARIHSRALLYVCAYRPAKFFVQEEIARLEMRSGKLVYTYTVDGSSVSRDKEIALALLHARARIV